MSEINIQKTYVLGEKYQDIKDCASKILGEYAKDPNVIEFNDDKQTLHFKTELLIPSKVDRGTLFLC